ncbi:hypothetical protein, partial [Psychrobacter sp. 1Y4]|uniref:hypothetical protein n=1 Tax=Psychrobacter sp. 1Y4 TaxID=3453575 RepID=UPI003F48CA92
LSKNYKRLNYNAIEKPALCIKTKKRLLSDLGLHFPLFLKKMSPIFITHLAYKKGTCYAVIHNV